MNKQQIHKYIDRNFELSQVFNEYVMKHPELMDDIPGKVTLVFIPFNDSGLAKYNLGLAKKSQQYDKWPIYQAIQYEKGWQVLPI